MDLFKHCVNIDIWHHCFAHLGINNVICCASMVEGMDITGLSVSHCPCKVCVEGKATTKMHQEPVIHHSKKDGDLVHVDIGGGGKISPALGTSTRYWISLIDNSSGWGDVWFIKFKSDAFQALKEMIREFEKNVGKV